MCTHLTAPNNDPIHPEHTEKSLLCYFFYRKHHDPSNVAEGQWRLLPADEFQVFNLADYGGDAPSCHLFGVYTVKGRLRPLGTRGETVAKFPCSGRDRLWHGFPMWRLVSPRGYARTGGPPPREALNKLVNAGVIDWKMRSQIMKGK